MNKSDLAKSISAKLSTIAKSNKLPYQTISMAFFLERLLARLVSDSKLSKSLVFKGGYVGLRVYESPRYTIDLDALLLNANINDTLKRTSKAAETDIGDGTWFVLESQTDLKTQGEYGGVRQVFRAGMGEQLEDVRRAQVIHFDVGIGDPITPGPVPVKTKELLSNDELSWLVYPVETIIAEKLQTLMDRGGGNSRSKDMYDLYYYLPQADGKTLKTAVQKCFSFRKTPIPLDPGGLLSKMDFTLMKKGWKSATSSLKNAPEFDEAVDRVVDELKRLLPNK